MAADQTDTAPTFRATGLVVESETREGLPSLIVTLYQTEKPSGAFGLAGAARLAETGHRLGSVMTDADGVFQIAYVPRLSDAGGPHLVLVVAGPDDGLAEGDGVLHVSAKARRSAGRVETFSIAIAGKQLALSGLGVRPTTQSRVASYKDDWAAEQNFSADIADFHKEEVKAEIEDREQFRKELLDQVATDTSIATFPGAVVTDNKIDESLNAVIERSVTKANSTIANARGVPVNLYLTADDRSRLQPFFDAAVDGFAAIPETALRDILFRAQASENPGTLLIHNNPIARFCAEQTFGEICASRHTDLAEPVDVEGDDTVDDRGGQGDDTVPAIAPLTNETVPLYAARFLDGARSPDDVLSETLSGKRLSKEGLEDAVDGFSLRVGPADVPAYYDFQSLQIAFDHVWKVLLDEEVVDTAVRLNKAYKKKTGFSLSQRFGGSIVETVNSPQVAYESVPRVVPAVVMAQFDITLPEWTDLNATYQAKLREIATELEEGCKTTRTSSLSNDGRTQTNIINTIGSSHACEKRRQDRREQGERLIDSVRHDDYYTLHKTLRDLKARLDADYEFTVFAANRSSQAVNFGLLNDYRQEWTPINYQAGKLVKTIPLTPKEERRYSMKVMRKLSHSQKEAVKNNSSVSAEQSSTSRVESEIMEKAQNKTDFNLNASGSYNVGVSKGKQTTTFGVEAQQESSSARKDFREAVLKATQEYKDERSVQIDTEESETSEYTESGIIINPNDELSVTYLFYELQRRYRVSEQLHRVQPVVLVAQEVPAPHQITESWVISNDWIINRALLDDSFRMALSYLGTKSVGDDFALRELRRNLRQQRNLVETLRLEYAMASREAENRYAALEGAISSRIGEEEEEATDGWFSDIGDFFGGGGQDPEAAKARELAAKDAHQRALERAEKQGAALKGEVRTLHSITREYNETLRTHLDNETRVKRLLVHIRKNIFHYMQAIWRMEPPDQRFMRLHKVKVPTVELATVPDPQNPAIQVPNRTYFVDVVAREDIFADFRPAGTTKHRAFMSGTVRKGLAPRPLVEVADLDSMLGFKGNYMIFPLKEHNALTEFMAAPYIDAAFGAMDPDELSNVSLKDYSRYVCCLHDTLSEEAFTALKPNLKKWLKALLSDPLRNGDEIVVPTGSLFIESLPGTHPLLEDFKLRHRELDVYKAQNEVRHGGLEALRLAARLVNSERGDPDVDKTIVVEGGLAPHIGVEDA
ncbi:hypothetical protein [Hydrogenophaga sp. PAMC20947]|uniref:hypothetical protein n=1 Tax=Hydrogenophaga sp. PAMC20947 TaxID=2565558 RepID=UPI00109DF488|nr:hypothetical protein [Hydrogenophaga sp. PAMC20947]QCB44899.1 hypothetical protein E5678_01910 [Hydrogenophaga sp. PAMC20947]